MFSRPNFAYFRGGQAALLNQLSVEITTCTGQDTGFYKQTSQQLYRSHKKLPLIPTAEFVGTFNGKSWSIPETACVAFAHACVVGDL